MKKTKFLKFIWNFFSKKSLSLGIVLGIIIILCLLIVLVKGEEVRIQDRVDQASSSLASVKYASLPTTKPTATPIPSPSVVTVTPAATPTPIVNNTPPPSGYSYQTVSSDVGSFGVAIISADLSSTKVIVDTSSPSDCSNNCPALPLGDYVARNGAFAGVNGSFFCPPEYPDCKDKTNSFDTLLMNKNKVYFNSTNNVYSTIPAAIFYSGGARFVSRSLEWGRDTGVDAVIANYPLLVAGGNIVYGGGPEAKFNQRGARDFVGVKGSTVYIGIVYGATMVEAAHVLHSLGLSEALNLDEGGSTALLYGGYKAGPGRNIPNALLFVRR